MGGEGLAVPTRNGQAPEAEASRHMSDGQAPSAGRRGHLGTSLSHGGALRSSRAHRHLRQDRPIRSPKPRARKLTCGHRKHRDVCRSSRESLRKGWGFHHLDQCAVSRSIYHISHLALYICAVYRKPVISQ